MNDYDATFFRYVNASARVAAESIVPLLQTQLRAASILDIGCGQGAWLAAWEQCGGIRDCLGVDGDYVDRGRLLFPADRFFVHDLRGAFDFGRRFDLVQCLEVAEHLPAASAATLLDSLSRHGDVILFSAAPPGQGGHGHVNERNYEYWRAQFAQRDYATLDFLRPRIVHDRRIDPWYRYNPLLYVRQGCVAALSADLRSSLIPPGTAVSDLAPLPYRLRRQLLRTLPVPVMTVIARLKERVTARVAPPQSMQETR